MRRIMVFFAASVTAMLLIAPQAPIAAEKAPKADDKAERIALAKNPKWLLNLAQDDMSMEKQIAFYIAKVHRIKAKPYLNKKNQQDLILVYELAPPKAPKIPVIVNTKPWARDAKTKEVKARLIEIKATYVLPPAAKTDANLAKIRKLNDEFMWRLWSPFRIYITPRKNIRLASFIDYTGTVYKIHPEMVYNLLIRMMNSWGIYYNMLIKEVPTAKDPRKPKINPKAM